MCSKPQREGREVHKVAGLAEPPQPEETYKGCLERTLPDLKFKYEGYSSRWLIDCSRVYLQEPLNERLYSLLTWISFDCFEQQVQEHNLANDYLQGDLKLFDCHLFRRGGEGWIEDFPVECRVEPGH